MGQRIDDPKQRRSARAAELDMAMRRFFDLSVADQLRAYEHMRDFLGASAPAQSAADREIEQRDASLAALERVREQLGLDGKAPSVKEFDRVSRELGLGWTARRVGYVWGRWRFACDALLGERPRLTAVQQSLRHQFAGRKRSYEEYVTALRLWLATEPPLVRMDDYTAWARQHNATLQGDEAPLPRGTAIVTALEIGWPDAVRWGRGEIEFEQARKGSGSSYQDWTTGPHDLIGLATAAEILGLRKSACKHASYKPEFPTPTLSFVRGRTVHAWLREDIEVYRDTGKAPKPRGDGLRARYYTTDEFASLIGVLPLSILSKRAVAPPPTGCVGGVYYWLKRDADRWIRANRELIERRFARGPHRRRERAKNNRRRASTLGLHVTDRPALEAVEKASEQALSQERPVKNSTLGPKSAKSSR